MNRNLYNRSFSENLRAERLKKNLTQLQMGTYLNVNRATYTYYETGKTQPDIQTLKKICEILDITIEKLW